MIPASVVVGDESIYFMLQFAGRFTYKEVDHLLTRAMIPLDLSIGLGLIRGSQEMPQAFGFHIVSESL
jgi:hypothetical protein